MPPAPRALVGSPLRGGGAPAPPTTPSVPQPGGGYHSDAKAAGGGAPDYFASPPHLQHPPSQQGFLPCGQPMHERLMRGRVTAPFPRLPLTRPGGHKGKGEWDGGVAHEVGRSRPLKGGPRRVGPPYRGAPFHDPVAERRTESEHRPLGGGNWESKGRGRIGTYCGGGGRRTPF